MSQNCRSSGISSVTKSKPIRFMFMSVSRKCIRLKDLKSFQEIRVSLYIICSSVHLMVIELGISDAHPKNALIAFTNTLQRLDSISANICTLDRFEVICMLSMSTFSQPTFSYKLYPRGLNKHF